MPDSAPPTHRHRSKSAPRGRSPDPKALRRAAEKAKKTKGKKDEALVTPPPKTRNSSPTRSSSSSKEVRKKITFGPNSVHEIAAENKPQKEMDVSEADAILAAMQDTIVSCDSLLCIPTCSSIVSTSFQNLNIHTASLSTSFTLGFQSHLTGLKEKRTTCRKEAAGEDRAGQQQCRG